MREIRHFITINFIIIIIIIIIIISSSSSSSSSGSKVKETLLAILNNDIGGMEITP